MSDQKDPGIKLFGRVIPLASEPAPGATETDDPLCNDQPPEELQPWAPEEEEEKEEAAAVAADEVSMILYDAIASQEVYRLFVLDIRKRRCACLIGGSIYVATKPFVRLFFPFSFTFFYLRLKFI
jgi:hypothetical protein